MSCTSFILTFQSQGDGVWLLLVLGMSVCSPMNLHFDLYTVTGRHARFYTQEQPSIGIATGVSIVSGRKVGSEDTMAPSWNPVLRSALRDVKRR